MPPDLRTADSLSDVVRQCCLQELDALKPGNVHRHAGGHALQIEEFERSAVAMAPALCDPALDSVGARILAAVRATRRVVDTNTNLGIVLLCAPIIQAAHALIASTAGPWPEHEMSRSLHDVLAALDVNDAVAAYEAIRLAEPGGMGASAEQDVSATPTVSLREAMRLASSRDVIAAQYVDDFALIRQCAAPRYRELSSSEDAATATTGMYLRILSEVPDTLIVRRHGEAMATQVRRQAARARSIFDDAPRADATKTSLLEFDRRLKQARVNPGTTADLVVATLVWASVTRQSCG